MSTQKKRAFQIEAFKHRVVVDPKYAEKTWKVLEHAIHEIYNHNASGLSFEELYRLIHSLNCQLTLLRFQCSNFGVNRATCDFVFLFFQYCCFVVFHVVLCRVVLSKLHWLLMFLHMMSLLFQVLH